MSLNGGPGGSGGPGSGAQAAGSSCVIRNQFFLSDGPQDVNPMDALRYLQDAFKESIEPDVVHMLFTESGFNGTLSGLSPPCASLPSPDLSPSALHWT